jgi:hypothetical protein
MTVNTENDAIAADASDPIREARLWCDNGWTARVVKNEDDEGWAVEMILDGESEPALVGPWTMGRDKKNPKPLDAPAFNTLVKTAGEFRQRQVQQLHARLHQNITINAASGRISVTLDIVPDDDDPHALLEVGVGVGIVAHRLLDAAYQGLDALAAAVGKQHGHRSEPQRVGIEIVDLDIGRPAPSDHIVTREGRRAGALGDDPGVHPEGAAAAERRCGKDLDDRLFDLRRVGRQAARCQRRFAPRHRRGRVKGDADRHRDAEKGSHQQQEHSQTTRFGAQAWTLRMTDSRAQSKIFNSPASPGPSSPNARTSFGSSFRA